jgi:hypothetical protein
MTIANNHHPNKRYLEQTSYPIKNSRVVKLAGGEWRRVDEGSCDLVAARWLGTEGGRWKVEVNVVCKNLISMMGRSWGWLCSGDVVGLFQWNQRRKRFLSAEGV